MVNELQARILRAAHTALFAAGRFLQEKLQEVVGHDPGSEYIHSPPGTPPYKHSGVGQDSIECRMAIMGNEPVAKVGIFPDSEGFYMRLHTFGKGFPKRPWLQTYEKYLPETRIVFCANFHP